MAGKDYEVGDTLEYRTFTGAIRKIVVTNSYDDVKNGQPGFDGTLVDPDPSGWNDVWGYDDQIVRVTRDAKKEA